LKLLGDIKAHQVNVFSLAADGDIIYSCSNDGTICAWKLPAGGGNLVAEGVVRPENEAEVLRLRFSDGKLYAGDVRGNVSKPSFWRQAMQPKYSASGAETANFSRHPRSRKTTKIGLSTL